MSDFTFVADRLSDAAVADIAPDFESLQPSDYADGAYRYRRYSHVRYDKATKSVSLAENVNFLQSDEYNHHQGGVSRRYDDLLPSTWQSQGFADLVRAFVETADLPDDCDIEAHQMRIIAKEGAAGADATPEGVHQDGYDRICVCTAGRRNSYGGQLALHRAKDEAAFVTLFQEPGQYVVEDDSTFWHSAVPVCAISPDAPGTFDLFILTANR